MKRPINRRRFLQGTAVVAAGFWVVGKNTPALSKSPNEKLNVGIIGVAHRGAANTQGVATENIVALCDIDDNYLAEAKKKFPGAKTYNDWRELVQQKSIDAVVVSTTDHTHALASVAAMKNGKHVYCEKPLGHTVFEARRMGEVYRQSKLATQMGTQIHATDNYRRVVELVQSGAVGPIREVHVWCGRHGAGGGLPVGADPVPKTLHWDLWLGPAPVRPYNKAYMPGNMTWNKWWDFGNGTIGDMGSHLIDLPFWALGLRYPTSAQAYGTELNPYTNPKWLISTWQHPAKGKRPALKLTWYDGIQRPKSPPGQNLEKWGIGVMFIGAQGILLADYGKRILLPEEKFKNFKPPKPWIPPSLGHHQEWIHACKTGAPTLCNFDYSGALIEHNLLGNVAYRMGEKLQWDPKTLQATNCPAASQYITKKYRSGWEIG